MLTDILSAVVSMLIGGALLKAFQIWILPMMDQYLHSVPRLDGTKWKYSKGILEITQFGTRIKAKAVRSDGDTIGTFKYQGKIISPKFLTHRQDNSFIFNHHSRILGCVAWEHPDEFEGPLLQRGRLGQSLDARRVRFRGQSALVAGPGPQVCHQRLQALQR